MRQILLLTVSSFLLFLTSCDKYKNYKKVTVVDTKNVSSEGCGYIFVLADGTEQKPQYLPSSFQHDGLKVKVDISELGTSMQCDADTITKWLPLVVVNDIVRDLDNE